MAVARPALECDIHLFPLTLERWCPYCVRFLETAPDASELSKEARLEELERWLLAERSVPEHMLYERVEALVGRRISMHELDNPDVLMRRAQRPNRWDDWDDW